MKAAARGDYGSICKFPLCNFSAVHVYNGYETEAHEKRNALNYIGAVQFPELLWSASSLLLAFLGRSVCVIHLFICLSLFYFYSLDANHLRLKEIELSYFIFI